MSDHHYTPRPTYHLAAMAETGHPDRADGIGTGAPAPDPLARAAEIVEECRDASPAMGELAELIDHERGRQGSLDAPPGSPGAQLLRRAETAALEAVEFHGIPDIDRDRFPDGESVRDVAAETADGIPDAYTYGRWREFVDLAAWDEDDPAPGDGDLTDTAGRVLYGIAERLILAVFEEVAETPAPSARCRECGRVFDLADETDAAEWSYGHDCEAG